MTRRALVCALALLAACKRTPPLVDVSDAVAPTAGPSTSQSSSTTAASSAIAPPVASSTNVDRAWFEARSGDPLELARLADLEGTSGLLDRLGAMDQPTAAGVAPSSEVDRLTALRALAFVDDPTPALDVVAKAAISRPLERSTVALQTLAAIAPRRLQVEEDDPGAWRRCADTLLEALVSIRGDARRELLVRALLGLAERGAVERSKIPER